MTSCLSIPYCDTKQCLVFSMSNLRPSTPAATMLHLASATRGAGRDGLMRASISLSVLYFPFRPRTPIGSMAMRSTLRRSTSVRRAERL